MLPYMDTVARRYPPVVVWALLSVNVLSFLFQASLAPWALERFVAEYALTPARAFGEISDPYLSLDWTPFFTNMFLHGGWLHLIANMWSLWIFGPAVEDRLGPVRFLFFYLVCGIAAGWAHCLANPLSTVPALGASGAIAGIIGCYARLFPAARLILLIPIVVIPVFVEVRALYFALIWFALQVIPGLLSAGQDLDAGGVAWWAHIGGFVAGWLLTPLLCRSPRSHRRYYGDEGAYGFRPDGY